LINKALALVNVGRPVCGKRHCVGDDTPCFGFHCLRPDAYFRVLTVRVKGLCSHIHISSMGHALVAPPGFECLTLKRRT
jgi:hypothetical protein